MTTYGSVCSGIEAASVAWEPIGWKPAWFAEIEPFPCAVLTHHWPHVTNLGDMTKIAAQVANDNVPAPDVLVGGTPCQAFSVAGARRGLDDDRGFLTIKFVELANAIDQKRAANDNQPAVIVWENVPGVLSTKDNAFGAFLGLLSGEDCLLVPPGRKWTNAGYVHGPQRTIAWRVLDAQYFGVAQRRRRVFVVASAREGFDPAAVLFEREGVRRDTAPSREKGTAVAALTANGVGTCGADDNQGQAGHLVPIATSTWPVSHCLNAGGMGRIDYETETMVVHGTQDPDTNTELAHTLGRNQGQENAVAYPLLEIGKRTGTSTTDPRAGLGVGGAGDPMFTLQAGAQHGVCVTGSVTHTLKAEGFDASEDASEDGTGRGQPIVPSGMAVRRLTPVECERLQDFPDGHTNVPYRGKPASDGPRYKAIGNSMAVCCMEWIGNRINTELCRTIGANDNKQHAEYAAHAIDSHDELVLQRDECQFHRSFELV